MHSSGSCIFGPNLGSVLLYYIQRKIFFRWIFFLYTPLTAGQEQLQCSNSLCNGDLALASFEAQIPTKQACQNTRCFAPLARVQECIFMAPRPWHNLVCAHDTILSNRKPSKLVGECIFYAFQVRTRTGIHHNSKVWHYFHLLY